jgi:hypothetical protein
MMWSGEKREAMRHAIRSRDEETLTTDVCLLRGNVGERTYIQYMGRLGGQ